MHISMITIAVDDMAVSAAFYQTILEMREVRRFSTPEGTTIVFMVDKNGCTIELIEYPATAEKAPYCESRGRVSIAYEVSSIKATQESMETQHIPILRGPLRMPSGIELLFIADPNGVEIEFIAYPVT